MTYLWAGIPRWAAASGSCLWLYFCLFSPDIGVAADQAPREYDQFARTNLVAWCIVPFDARKRGPEERAAMLEKLGLKLFAYDYRAEHVPTFDAEMEALDRHHVRLLACGFRAS